jgi:acyl carrier protein
VSDHALEDKLKYFILEAAPKKSTAAEICATTNLITDLEFDSILIVQLMLDLEETFGFIFEDEEIEDDTLTNFKKLSDLISNKVTKC